MLTSFDLKLQERDTGFGNYLFVCSFFGGCKFETAEKDVVADNQTIKKRTISERA